MGSMGNERGSSSSSSSRKGKKNGSTEKPKQPQRGLGVAQLEKIRLHGEISSSNYHFPHPSTFNHQEDMRMQPTTIASSTFSYSSLPVSSTSYGYHQNIMMGRNEYERNNMRYGESQTTTRPSWNPSHGIIESQYFVQPKVTRHLLNLHVEDGRNGSRNSDSSDSQELDLELRL